MNAVTNSAMCVLVAAHPTFAIAFAVWRLVRGGSMAGLSGVGVVGLLASPALSMG